MIRLILYITLFSSLLPINVFSQNNVESHFSVEWISNFSHENEIKTEGGILSQFMDLVLGKTEEKLVKPFNIVKYDEDSYFILDQGRLSAFLVTKDGFETIQNDEYKTFPSLVGVCKFRDDKILFTDSKLSKIFSYNLTQEKLTVFSTSQSLDNPTGITYDETRNLIYVSETINHRILVFNQVGELINTIGERGNNNGQFNFPTFITLDNNGNLFVVDALNFRIQIFNATGKHLKSFGEAGDATGYFSRPKGIAVDTFGHVFIVDALFHTVQVFDFNGNYLYNFGGLGQQNSRFWLPTGITIDNDNNIYVADSYNSRIQIFRLIDDK
jgi:DNA-binding beta-propeller fold protein YncE